MSQSNPPVPGTAYASFVSRFIAYVIDQVLVGLVVGLALVVIGLLTGMAGQAGFDFLAGFGIIIGFLLFFVIWLGYYPYFWSRNGQTPGNRVMGIRVVSIEDGGTIGFGGGIIRLIGYMISAAIFYLGFIWAAFDARKQGWHDKLAETIVIKA